jgi:hypothetical protein
MLHFPGWHLTCVLAAAAGARSHPQAALAPEVRPSLVLWLSPASVEAARASRAVARWRDESGGGYVFAPLTAAQQQAAGLRWRTAVARQRAVLAPDDSPPARAAGAFVASAAPGGGVRFPAPLVASALQLRDGVTCFFVLTPAWLRDGDRAVGQRFFGHYPLGQFRFHDRRVAFRTAAGDISHSKVLESGTKLVVAYRLDGRVEMAVDGAPFEAGAKPRAGASPAPVFSASGYVTLGGCPPHDAFLGDVHEVMVFGTVLADAAARHVAEVLATKHGVAIGAVLPEASRFGLPTSHATGTAAAPSPPTPRGPPPLADFLEARVAGEWEADPDVQRGHPFRARQRASARDRVASYATLKDGRDRERREADARAGGRTHRARRGAPSGGDPRPPLLARLQEAQQRLNEIQGAVDAMRPAPDLRAPPAGRGRRDRGPPPPTPPVAPAAADAVPELAERGAPGCLGGDAFGRAPVARWEPPETARLEQIQQWKKLKAQSDAAIRGFARGGKELRAFVSDQVDRLRLARHNLFCNLAHGHGVA